jgi:hypothetical protein
MTADRSAANASCGMPVPGLPLTARINNSNNLLINYSILAFFKQIVYIKFMSRL